MLLLLRGEDLETVSRALGITAATLTTPRVQGSGRLLVHLNGLVYVRGNPLDFETRQEQGARGWGWSDVLPYFRRAETRARMR